jgi:hypothetical protein
MPLTYSFRILELKNDKYPSAETSQALAELDNFCKDVQRKPCRREKEVLRLPFSIEHLARMDVLIVMNSEGTGFT